MNIEEIKSLIVGPIATVPTPFTFNTNRFLVCKGVQFIYDL